MSGHVTPRIPRLVGVAIAALALVVGLISIGSMPRAAAAEEAEPRTGSEAVLDALDAGETLDVRSGLEALPGGGVTGDGLPSQASTSGANDDAPSGDVTVSSRDRAAASTELPVTPRRATGVESTVRDVLSDDDTVSVIVRLTSAPDHAALAEGADLAAATRSTSSAAAQARTSYVVESLQELAESTQGDVATVLDRLEDGGHADDVESFWIVNGFAATVDAMALDTLADHPDIASITLDETHHLPEPQDVDGEPTLPEWSLESIDAPKVWGDYGVDGEGVTVGVLDSGVDGDHPALAQTWRGRNGDTESNWWVGTGEDYPRPGDGSGHGTHVTGSIVGQAPGDVTGVAPGAEWMAAKIFNDFGSTSDAIIHSAFEFMMAPGGDPAKAPDIVTNSWGAPDGTRTEFWDDVSALVAADIVPMFANGNDGPGTGTVGSPGSYPHAIGVGAVDINDVAASFSSRGPITWDGVEYIKPQIAAPGVDIHSTWPTDLDPDGYHTISGTSMATPHVTGVVALMLSAAPELSVDEVRDALTDTARVEPHMGEVPNNTYGNGIVDAYAAVTRVAYAGEIEGTITDAESGMPIEATIAVGDEVETTSDPETGQFHAYVGEGTYDVTISAYGYTTVTTEATIAVDQVVTVDAELAQADVHQLTGTVTSADDAAAVHRATIAITGADVDNVRTDENGSFAVDVAAGTHEVAVRAVGYAPTGQEVVVDGDVHLDITLDPLSTPTAEGWAQFQNNPGSTGYTAESIGAPSLAEEWTTSVGASVTFSSPTIADGTVYLADDGGHLSATDLATGDQQWRVQVSTTSVVRGAPLVADGTVYVGAGLGGGITALDAETGQVRWTTPTPERDTVYLQATLVDGTLYAVTGPTNGTSDTVYALDPANGAVQWSTDVGELVYAGPAVSDGYVVVGNGNDGRLMALDAETGEIAWTLQRTTDYFVGAPSIADGVVYTTTTEAGGTGGGSLLAVDLTTGTLLWENAEPGDGQGTTPAVYGDVVVAGSHATGVVTAYDRVDGSVTWQHPISGAVSSSVLTSADGYVVFGSQLDHRVVAVDAATGDEVWSVPTTTNVTSSAAFADGTLVTVDGRGEMTAHGPRGTVTGTVDSGWAPLSATVRVAETGVEVESDAETGQYELVHRPGTYTLEFVRYGKTTVTETVDIRAADTVVVDATLRQAPSGSLGGQVVDADGNPVAGAVVTIEDTTARPITTGPTGVFFFPTVFAGTHTVSATLGGFVPWTEQVTISPSTISSIQPVLRPYDVALVGDHEGQMEVVLADLGYTVKPLTYAEATEHADDYATIVVNGYEDDPGQEGLEAFIAATDDAGTSVVWLDQYGVRDGGITHLHRYTGDPAENPHGLSGGRSVSVEPTVEHPLVDGLEVGAATEILGNRAGYAAYRGWSGTTVADIITDSEGRVGDGIGYAPRTTDSVHVLLGSLQARSSWGDPTEKWTDAATMLVDNAVRYATDAAFAEVNGTVTDADGEPVAGATVASATGTQPTTTADDGSYRLLVTGGSHDITVSAVGYVSDTATVDLDAGDVVSHDVSLAPAGVGTLTGTVTSEDGSAVEGATVTVAGPDVTATTAADGTYTITDLAAGTWAIEVTADGYLSDATQVEVVRDDTTTHDVALTAATRVGVVGDRSSDSVLPVLEEAELVGVEMTWTDTAALAEVDVVVLNGSSDPGEEAFHAFLDAADAASTSVIFTDGYFSSEGSLDVLRDYAGYPAESGDIEGDGAITLIAADDPPHPVFAGLDPQTQILNSDGRGTTIEDYPGDVLAQIGTVGGEAEGAGLVYRPRTAGSVEVVVTGLASSLYQGPEEEWTEDARTLYRNLVTWAAAPGVGGVSGTITDTEGTALSATISQVDGGQETVADANGEYAIALPPGDHTLLVESPGYLSQEVPVTVLPDSSITRDVALERSPDAAALSGTVFSSGSVSVPDGGGDLPLADAQVQLVGTGLATTTDTDGEYAFPTLSAGTWQVEITADGHVRSRHSVEVGADTVHDHTLRTTPTVGVIDDYQGHAAAYLADWGYEVSEIAFTDIDRIGEVDMIVANMSMYPVRDPGAADFATFRDAALRSDIPIVWLDQYSRGSHEVLAAHEGDPAARGQDRANGVVTATVSDPNHPLATDLPESFELIEEGREYSWFEDFGGTTVFSVAGTDDPTQGGDLAGARGFGASAVDVLVGTLSISYYGWPAYADTEARRWKPEAEQLLRNALTYALDAPPLGAEVEASVTDPSGNPVPATVTVLESGRTFTADDDGSLVAPLDPGTWTLRYEQFGHEPVQRSVSVEAGDVVTDAVVLPVMPAGTVTGVVTDPTGPVDGAALVLGETGLTATTDAEGRYTFTDVPEGSYRLVITSDGHMKRTADVAVSDGESTVLDLSLEIAAEVAVVEDATYGSIEGFLGEVGYGVDTFDDNDLTDLATTVADYDLVILNGSIGSSYDDDLEALLDGADAAGTSTIVAGQWGGGAVNSVSRVRGNPATVDWSFVSDSTIHYTPAAAHPIFAGFAAGEPITLIGNDSTNQQWLSFDDYDGTVLASVGSPVDESLGSGVGYRFTSPSSVEVVLASLGASRNGRPDAPEGDSSRWTEDARAVYLNAVEWAITARQGAVTGVVSGPDGAVEGATVSVGPTTSTTTDADGAYTLLLPDGSYTMTVSALGYEPSTVPVEIVDAGTVTADVDLTPLPEVTVTGTITSEADAAPVAGAVVVGSNDAGSWTATSEEDGTYSAPDVPVGGYEMTVTAPGYLSETGTLTVTTDEPAIFDATLTEVDVAVLDENGSSAADDLADWLVEADVATETITWDDAATDLSQYTTILVNGGDPAQDQYDAVVGEAAEHEATLVHLGTWGVDNGGLRLLERHTDRMTIADHGYGGGPVTLSLTDPAHPIVAGLDEGAEILGTGGYYSTIASYDGTGIADIEVTGSDGDVDSGIGVGHGTTAAGGREAVLAASAVTPNVGPDHGWTAAHRTLLLDTITWARSS